MRHWLRRHQHTPGVLQALALAQVLHRARGVGDLPAIAGGRPDRALPLPPPRPVTRAERRRLAQAGRTQGTSFFDHHAVRRFEDRLGELWGARHVLVTSSGTAALHTALMAAGIGPGHEVIVPVWTYVATALAVVHAGATPVFVDVDPSSWNLDPARVEEAVSSRTRAVIPVHMGGVPCDMAALMHLAEARGLLVIEDAAHAHGSRLDGRHLGTIGHVGCFSFGAPKSVTTGEGGALLTDDADLARRARMAMNLGECTPEGEPSMTLDLFAPETRLDYPMVGWNYRMSVAQAAMGLGQLDRFAAIRARRAANGALLREALGALPGMRVQRVRDGADPCYYAFPISLAPDASLSRGELLAGLARERIDYRLSSNLPLSAYAIFGQTERRFPVAEEVAAGFVGLRVDPALGPREMDETALAIRRLLEWGARRRVHHA